VNRLGLPPASAIDDGEGLGRFVAAQQIEMKTPAACG
jgi:hypothetical protein